MRKGYKMLMVGSAGVIAAGLAGGYALARPQASVVSTEIYDIPVATVEDLEAVGGLRVFFGHQSVGRNILAEFPAIFAAHDVPAPDIIESTDPNAFGGPAMFHVNIGRNRDPLGKVAEFDRVLRDGMGDEVDVAVLKLCYIDFRDGADVDAVFAEYRDTMAALERDFPDVTFIYSTVPITIERGPLGRVKARLGRPDGLSPEHNVVREQFNNLIRAEYGSSGRLFDIAAIQSTDEDGTRTLRRYDGDDLYMMETFLASDPGHLNARGGRIAGNALLALIAAANR